MPPTLWERVKTGGKKGFDATWKAADKLGAPVNKLSNKLGSEAFWPTTLDKESDKAARILQSFCKDGFYAEEERQAADGPQQKQKVVKKIPAEVIKNAKGLAIFTTMRTGLWVSGAGGSGILVGRLPDGSWSPPSGILLHTAGLGFLVGVDIYDCVVVINTEEALQAFTKIRCTLGSEISVAAGPVGAGGILESELHKRQAPIFTYLKSRGFYAGVQIDGTVIIERTDENERFYNERIPVADILAGKVRHPPYETRRLMETIKAAQGDTHFDESILPSEPPPGDYVIDDGQMFGVPDKEDPDPYGVLALEKEGLSLKEAGTHKRASWETFSFNPSPTSPVHQFYSRRDSSDKTRSVSMRNSWRSSALPNEPKTPSSLRPSMDSQQERKIQMVETSTQTDSPPPPLSPGLQSARSGASRRSSRSSAGNNRLSQMQNVPEGQVLESPKVERNSASHINGYTTPPVTPPLEGEKEKKDNSPNGIDGHDISDHDSQDDSLDGSDDDDFEDAIIVEPVVQSVQTFQPTSPQPVSQARLVTVAKRIPPKLPARNPNRGQMKSPTPSEPIPEVNVHAPEETSNASISDSTSEKIADSGSPPKVEYPMANSDKRQSTASGAERQSEEQEHLATKLDDVNIEDSGDSDIKEKEARTSGEVEDAAPKRTSMPGGFD